MESRHSRALRRIAQADAALRREGAEPATFHLVHRGGMESEIDHPRWDRSWATPSEHTIDDLGELGLLRVQPSHGKARTFDLSLKGRQEGDALIEQLAIPVATGGRAPRADAVLRWLVDVANVAPECFELPSRLLDRARSEQFIEATGRNAFARRILGLIDDGYLRGDVPDLDQATAEQVLANTSDLELTITGLRVIEPVEHSAQLTILGSVINSQVATGDITQFSVFMQVLDRAADEIDALDGIDPETRDEAKGLLDRLRGSAASATGDALSGAAGELVAGVLARLVGLPPV